MGRSLTLLMPWTSWKRLGRFSFLGALDVWLRRVDVFGWVVRDRRSSPPGEKL